MAAGYVSPPGTEYGPCERACEHRDCAASRRTAESLCGYCKHPIGYGAAYFRTYDDDDAFIGNEHDTCSYDRLGV